MDRLFGSKLDLSHLPLFMRIMGRAFALLGLVFSSERFTNVSYQSTTDPSTTLRAYLATPPNYNSGGTFPTALVLHAWNGMGDEPVYFADLLAQQGYIALAPDLFRGVASKETNVPWNIATVSRAPQGRMDEDLNAALTYLRQLGKVNERLIFSGPGFCFGGAQALELSKRMPMAATLSLYGSSIDELQDPNNQDAWGMLGMAGTYILGIYGAEDNRPSPEEARGFQSAMSQRGIAHKVTIYDGVGHAFVNPKDHKAGKAQATAAWNEVVAYMKTVVDGGGLTERTLHIDPIQRNSSGVVSKSWLLDHAMDAVEHKGHFHNHNHLR